MWPRKTLDIGFFNLFRGLSYTVWSQARDSSGSQKLNTDGRCTCLSVRSGFDTLLRSLNLPTGSEVLLSELTISDMERIVSANGLKPTGVGLNRESWTVDLSLLEESITPNTRAIVVAHLFGRRDSLREISKIARRHDLLLIEDCAQSFRGPCDIGDPDADVSMFSFGPIKTNTCLGGAIFHFRNPQLREEFECEHEKLPQQSNRSYAKRLAKYVILKCFNSPFVYGMLFRVLILFGCDPDLTISGLARGFAGSDFFSRIRKRPAPALVRLIESRLKRFDPQRLVQRTSLGRELTSLLSPSVEVPAHSGFERDGYWVFPVLSIHPESLKVELVQNGFDATQRSSLAVTPNRFDERTAGEEFLKEVVFLPLSNRMSKEDIEQLAEIVNSHERRWKQARLERRQRGGNVGQSVPD